MTVLKQSELGLAVTYGAVFFARSNALGVFTDTNVDTLEMLGGKKG